MMFMGIVVHPSVPVGISASWKLVLAQGPGIRYAIPMPNSAFLHVELPTSGTWFYATLAVAVAVFYQFSRIFALRNVDLIGLFFFTPGFLILEDAQRKGLNPFFGYAWLLGVSAYWFLRCLLDATAVKKPRIAPNLSTPGLFFLGFTLLLGLSIATATTDARTQATIGQRSTALDSVEAGATAVAQQANPVVTDDSVRRGVERGIAIACQVAVATLLVLIGRYHFQQWATGACAATLYLLLPFTAEHFGQSHHVWPTAFTLAAIMAYRKPGLAGAFLGFAAGTSFFPLLLLPAWLQFYKGRGLGHFLSRFGIVSGISLLGTVLSFALTNPQTNNLWYALNQVAWQPWNATTGESIWIGAQWAYRLPVFIAMFCFVLGTFLWPASRDLGQLLASCSAILISIQFWLADGGGRYVLWYSPLLILMALRPTTVELQPPSNPEGAFFGWLRRKKSVPLPTPPTLAI